MSKITIVDSKEITPCIKSFKEISVGTAFISRYWDTDDVDDEDTDAELRIKISNNGYINLSNGLNLSILLHGSNIKFLDYKEVDLEIKVIHKS